MFNLKVNRTNGGIGRQATGTDYYSGILYYLKSTSSLPTAFATNQIQPLTSILDLVALGIDGKSGDETRAAGSYLNTGIGSNGDTATFTFTDPITGVVITLGTYTKVTGDSTATLVDTGCAASINALTYIHGFVASISTATLVITCPAGYGLSPNSGTPFAVTYSAGATIAGTLTQPTGSLSTIQGVGSEQDAIYYHVREAFRMQGVVNNSNAQGKIWLGIYKGATATYSAFNEVLSMQAFAVGQIKQLLVCGIGTSSAFTTFATSQITALQVQVAALQVLNTPLRIIYQPNLKSVADITAVTNLLTLNSDGVQCVIAQDGGNLGYKLFKALGASVGSGGTILGGWAAAKVMQSAGWRGGFNFVDSLEYTTLAFCNGQSFASLGANLYSTQTTVDSYGYVFLMNETSPQSSALFGGVFLSNDQMCVTATSDYAYMPNGRTIDKASVGVRAAILPALGGNVYFNADGTLTTNSLLYLQHLGDSVIGGKSGVTFGSMVQAGEISDGQTIISPTQNVQGTNMLTVTISIIQAGVLRQITINIGFKASLTA